MLQHRVTLDWGRGRRNVPHHSGDQGLHAEAGHQVAPRHLVEVVQGGHLAITGSAGVAGQGVVEVLHGHVHLLHVSNVVAGDGESVAGLVHTPGQSSMTELTRVTQTVSSRPHLISQLQ